MKNIEDIRKKYFDLLRTYKKELLNAEYPIEVVNEIETKCGKYVPFYYSSGVYWNMFSSESRLFGTIAGNSNMFFISLLHFGEIAEKTGKKPFAILKDDEKFIKMLLGKGVVKRITRETFMIPIFGEEIFTCNEKEKGISLTKKEIPKEYLGFIEITPFSIEFFGLTGYIAFDKEIIEWGLENKGVVQIYFNEFNKNYVRNLLSFIGGKIGSAIRYYEGEFSTFEDWKNDRRFQWAMKVYKKIKEKGELIFNPAL
jgi:hypothetical protein